MWYFLLDATNELTDVDAMSGGVDGGKNDGVWRVWCDIGFDEL